MSWHKLVDNPKAIAHLYNDIPPLHGMEVIAIKLNRDGPMVRMEMDFPVFADHRPHRWSQQWNTVAIQLDFISVTGLKIGGLDTSPVLDFAIQKQESGLLVEAAGGGMSIHFQCENIYIQAITGYTNSERAPLPQSS